MLEHLFNNEHPTLTARHPLLEEVWLELEKNHPGKSRKQIYNSHKGTWIPKSTCETYRYYSTGSEDPLFERIRFACNDEMETQMERFLRDIYNTEEHYDNRVLMRDAIDSVCILRNTTGTKIIGNRLQKSLDYLQEKFVNIGLFVIIPNIKDHKPITFTNFNSFKDAFLKRARRALRLGEIPTFRFGCTGYIDIINEIKNTADWITRSFAEKALIDLNFEMALSIVYDCARSFERIHSEPYTSMTIGISRLSNSGKDVIAKINSKKAFNYDKLRHQVISYVDSHKRDPNRSIDRAAKELAKCKFFPCLKRIKEKFKEELEPMRTTKKIKVKEKD